ncbi:MAG: hypothetical protein OCD01_14345 [Fibrobacterales bacterium]
MKFLYIIIIIISVLGCTSDDITNSSSSGGITVATFSGLYEGEVFYEYEGVCEPNDPRYSYIRFRPDSTFEWMDMAEIDSVGERIQFAIDSNMVYQWYDRKGDYSVSAQGLVLSNQQTREAHIDNRKTSMDSLIAVDEWEDRNVDRFDVGDLLEEITHDSFKTNVTGGGVSGDCSYTSHWTYSKIGDSDREIPISYLSI